jgi:uncharacterized protein (DUF2164 family)
MNKYLYTIHQSTWVKVEYKLKILTFNKCSNILGEKKFESLVDWNKTMLFNRYMVIKNQKEVLDKLKARTLHFLLRGIDIKITIDENNHLLFNGSNTLAGIYINKTLNLRECNHITKYIEKELNEDIFVYDAELFFKNYITAKILTSFINDGIFTNTTFAVVVDGEQYNYYDEKGAYKEQVG